MHDAMRGLDDATRLLRFAQGALLDSGGFGRLDDRGVADASRPAELLITARMTYCFSLGVLLGVPSADRYAAHGVESLLHGFRDVQHGGYLSAGPQAGVRKTAYQHAFVALAASAAVAAKVPGADDLLDDITQVLDRHYWSDADAALVESWDRAFTDREPYWGANANMHGVEAFLAVYGQTGDPLWRDRATAIARNLIDGRARAARWMLPEHFDADWTVRPDYNRDRPADEFRPYGVTIGHLFEWSRLLVELSSTYASAPEWIVDAAEQLYRRAAGLGWAVDGQPGFVYTVDWDGAPVVRQRPHWVAAEAIAAAATWRALTGDPRYRHDELAWTAYAARHLHDHVHGSWHHELDPSNRPASTTWPGKPDAYHALHAIVIPLFPVAESVARRILITER